MSVFINRNLLEQTSFSSTAPAGLACVVHAVAEEGEHELHFVGDDDAPPETMGVTVAGQRPTGEATAARLDVNPAHGAARLSRGPSESPAHHVIQPGADLFITTPAVRDARQVRLVRKTDGAVVFDSASLGAGDRFAVTLIRPGRYQVENQLDGAKLVLTVEYPVVGKQPYSPPPPMQIGCTAGGFHAPATTVKPAQGLIFLCSAPARLHLALVEPDDGPHKDAGPTRTTGSGPPHAPLTEEAREVLRRVLRTFRGKRDGG
jgi:hypothetical protein